MAELFHQLLVSAPNGGGVFLLHHGAAYRLDHLDTTGLDIRGERLIRAVQPDQLILFMRSARQLGGAQRNIDDLHDAYFDGESCYVVSTHGNEIVRLNAHGDEDRRWTFPGAADAWHVNCITRWNGRIVFSAFSDRPGHRAYKEPPLDVGFVQELETGARLITGLFQPHSLVPSGKGLLLANSGAFEIRAYDAAGALLRTQRLDGYTRGVAHRGDVIYVGVSKSRNVDTGTMTSAAIVALDARTWTELGRIRIPVDEVYSIVPLAPESDIVGTLARLVAHSSAQSADALADAQRRLAGETRAHTDLAGQLEAVVRDRNERTRDTDRKLYGLLETVQGKDVQIQNRDQIIRDKDGEIQRRDGVIAGKDAQLAGRDAALKDSERKIFGLLETVQGKDVQIQNRDQVIRDKDGEIQRRDGVIAGKDAQLAERDAALKDSERKIFGLLETVQGKDVQIQNRDQIIRDKDAEVQRREGLLAEKDAQLEAAATELKDKDRQVFGLLETVQGKDVQIQNRDQIIRGKDGEIQRRDGVIASKDVQLASLASELALNAQTLRDDLAELRRTQDTLMTQQRAVADRDQAIATLQRTLSWRLTKPLRAMHRAASWAVHGRWLAPVVRPINKARHVYGTLRRTLGDPEPRMRYLTLARVLGPRLAIKHTIAFLRRGGPRPRAPIPVPVFDIRDGHHRRAVILTTPHCDFVAASIQHALARIGVPAEIIHERPAAGYADLPHFVICPQMFESLPGLYVAFQMEQSVSTRWFTPEYVRQLENSFAIFDYSTTNIDALVQKGLHRKQFFYMPLGYLPDYGQEAVPPADDYDVVFYGDINNERRRRFVAALERVCKVKVLHNAFGDELHAVLAKAKLVVNIHYYEGALLETTRLWECVSLGKLVVSERAANMDENRDLESLLDFVDINDVDGMVERVRFWLEHDDNRIARITANNKHAREAPNRFEYFFYRFMLAFDNLSFFHFWQLAGSRLTVKSDRLCLNLPEWTRRRRSFERDNHDGFEVFPGLRHRDGWIGCGLSYKLMIMLARKQKRRQITICEDDAGFGRDFSADLAAIRDRLAQKRGKWDVFSGLLGDLHADAQVSQVTELRGRKLAMINKLISTVFNIYNRTVFDRVVLWDERDRDVNTNTIDRYLEHTRLAVLVCYPFLVEQKEDLHSTLWGVQNSTMNDMINRSERLLGTKIDAFERHAQGERIARSLQ